MNSHELEILLKLARLRSQAAASGAAIECGLTSGLLDVHRSFVMNFCQTH